MSKLIKNSFIYTLGSIFPQAVNFILLPVFTIYLSPTDYGIINSMQVLGNIMLILFTLCMERSIYRLYHDYSTEKEKRIFLGTITISIFGLSLVMLALFFLFHSSIERIYSNISFYPYFSVSIFTVFFSVFSLIPQIYYQITEKAMTFLALSFAQFLLVTIISIIKVVVYSEGAIGLLEAALFANVIMIPIYLYIYIKKADPCFDFKILKKTFVFALPLVPSLLVGWVINFSDRIFIDHYVSLSGVGIYSLGYKIGMLVAVVGGGVTSAYSPLFYRIANTESHEFAIPKLSGINKKISILFLFIAFAVAFLSKEMIIIFINVNYLEAIKVVPLIAIAYFFSLCTSFFLLMIMQSKKTMRHMYNVFILMLLNVILNFILIPRLGFIGAAYSTVLTFFFTALLTYKLATKCYFIPFDWRILITYMLLFGTLFFTFQFFFNFNIHLTLLMKIIILLIIGQYFHKKYFDNLLMTFLYKKNST